MLSDEAILLFSLPLPPFPKGSPLSGKNLLLKEPILSLKSGACLKELHPPEKGT